MVTVYTPPATIAGARTVRLLDPELIAVGEKVPVVDAGSPLILRLTLPLNPLIGVTVTAMGSVGIVGTAPKEAGLTLIEKSGGGPTIKLTVVVWH